MCTGDSQHGYRGKAQEARFRDRSCNARSVANFADRGVQNNVHLPDTKHRPPEYKRRSGQQHESNYQHCYRPAALPRHDSRAIRGAATGNQHVPQHQDAGEDFHGGWAHQDRDHQRYHYSGSWKMINSFPGLHGYYNPKLPTSGLARVMDVTR